MRTHVEFRSDRFPAYEGEEEQINPGVWGKRLAEYLHAQLQANGIGVEEIDSEDWGWYIPLRDTSFPAFLGCGNYEEYPNGIPGIHRTI